MRWLAAIGFSVFALPLAFYFCLRGYAVLQHGYSWKQMDWNGDGTTTIAEFFEASDVGKREVIVDGRACIEFFAYKDAMPIRTDCP
ncbi:hypothetical protein J2T09_003616 [Neorhizobium huautlense]|uniref:EF-hand domain-containing protein n=1 Tax=Neorhizobium huautlense TaxID=67774 RepID=A0ABT9PWI4_9HYPH|nr:hypothetical protein [Neorhizobium huautlense]MDP9838844.1 hypothetical protein [Neorhizobium huautlense]